MDGVVGDNRTAELAQAITHRGAISTTQSLACCTDTCNLEFNHSQAVYSIVC